MNVGAGNSPFYNGRNQKGEIKIREHIRFRTVFPDFLHKVHLAVSA